MSYASVRSIRSDCFEAMVFTNGYRHTLPLRRKGELTTLKFRSGNRSGKIRPIFNRVGRPKGNKFSHNPIFFENNLNQLCTPT